MRVAVVVNGHVTNVVEAESVELLTDPVFAEVFGVAEFIAVDDLPVSMGWTRSGTDWIAPPPPEQSSAGPGEE